MIREAFRRAAHATSCAIGSPYAFVLAVLTVVIWALSGPAFHYSDTWQLVINTSTTVITFLVVFMIQNTQNRDSRAIHLKLDELIRAVGAARNRMVDLEDLPDEELARLAGEFQRLRDQPDAPRAAAEAPTPDPAAANRAPAQAKRRHGHQR
ncbi:MAG TPA: low affinity iron permease family protein [Kofleriaceae bacterium]|nr:low affinity iron permease family protein [Kofleriaceae bacterium]